MRGRPSACGCVRRSRRATDHGRRSRASGTATSSGGDPRSRPHRTTEQPGTTARQRACRLTGTAAHLKHRRTSVPAGDGGEIGEQLVRVRRPHAVVELGHVVEHPTEVTSIRSCHRTILPSAGPGCRAAPLPSGLGGLQADLEEPVAAVGAPRLPGGVKVGGDGRAQSGDDVGLERPEHGDRAGEVRRHVGQRSCRRRVTWTGVSGRPSAFRAWRAAGRPGGARGCRRCATTARWRQGRRRRPGSVR